MKNNVTDLIAEEAAIRKMLDKLMAAWDRQDVATMASLVTEMLYSLVME